VSTVAPAIDDTAAIEVRDLSKRYRGGTIANDHISFSIPKGAVFGLLGPNGAGKTTLVRQITGELAPTAGEIHVHHTDVLRHPLAAKALMGVVPQEASPYLHLKPGEHLSLFGRLHGLVNCAGITGRTNIKGHEVDLADFDAVYRINLRGAMVVSKAVLPRLLKHGYGRLLHVASIAGKEGNAGMAAYSATKAGLIGLVKSLAKDYPESGVTVNALAPAVIRTPLVDKLPAATVTYMTDKIPMRRCGELDEAAHMIAWIVSPACSFTTGFTFDLSGGRATY